MRTPENILTVGNYADLRAQTAEIVTAYKKSLETGELTKLETFKEPPVLPSGRPTDQAFGDRLQMLEREMGERRTVAKNLIKAMAVAKHPAPIDLAKTTGTGISTSTGFNFYDLRAPVRMFFPVNTPFRNSIPRIGRLNEGVGTAAHWMASRDVGSVYGGVSEGNRNQSAAPTMVPYLASYKELGMERQVTYTAQFAGEGYADNLADEHLRGLFSVQLQEEGMILLGNSGNTGGAGYGATGFRLTTCPTPTCAVATTRTAGVLGNCQTSTTPTPAGADLPYTAALTNQYVSVACVLLTAMGNPLNAQYGYITPITTAGGITPTYSRTNADGSSDTVFGGCSAISAISAAPVQVTGGTLSIKASIPAASLPLKGVFGYAWFVDVEGSNTGSLAGAKFAGVTTVPYCYVTGTVNGTQVGTASGLSVDHSYNALDFDGLFSYAAGTTGAYYKDCYGSTLTASKNGRVDEIETALLYIFQNFQCGVDEIWGSADAIECLDAAVRWSGTTASGFQFITQRDGQNNLLGGFVVSAYQSRFAVNSTIGGMAIPIRIHPMVPAGTLYFHLKNNPYPHSRAPYMAGMLVQRDYYSIEWPQISRAWPFGTYVHEVLAHEMPWIPAVITGIGPFVAN